MLLDVLFPFLIFKTLINKLLVLRQRGITREHERYGYESANRYLLLCVISLISCQLLIIVSADYTHVNSHLTG